MANEITKVSSLMKAVSGTRFHQLSLLKLCALFALFPAYVRDPIRFWTSGAADGEYCGVQQMYGWCSDGTRVKRQEILLPWADANPPDLNESCISLNLINSQFALDDVECAAQKHVLCEVNWGFI
jgi:hypothetical protein